jgi:acyl-CoA synthetase (AMP-forming)/AMP-acid ligase II
LTPARAADYHRGVSATLIPAFAALDRAAERAVTFLDSRGAPRSITHAEVWELARRFAGGLREAGLGPGDPVLLVLGDPQEAIVATLGSMAAGCPPVPVYPPAHLGGVPAALDHIRHVARRARARHAVAMPILLPFLAPARLAAHRFARLIDAAPADPERPAPADTAFLQFTSGSTAAPKGVVVTHGGLAANIAMIRRASHMDDDSVVTTWLPVYHDMGLIGTVLNALASANDLVVMPPLSFVRSPRLWLEAITRARGTHTAAPNFAYGLCARRVPDVSGLDLSSMRTFICGAEPIVPETLERFADAFAPAGLDRAALAPAYGLAEATLAVTFTPHLRGLRCDESAERRVPSCGAPLEGLEVRIAGGAIESPPARGVGEVEVRGPTVTPGYIHDADATRDAIGPDGWLRTGDVGYLHDGELHLCGRIKDVLIVHGRNVYAHDVEATAAEVPGVRRGGVAAFCTAGADRERVVVVAESRTPEDETRIARDVRSALHRTLRLVPDEIRIVAPGTIPKTSSGKLKRAATRDLYERRALGVTRGPLGTWGAVLRAGLDQLTRRRDHTPPPGAA